MINFLHKYCISILISSPSDDDFVHNYCISILISLLSDDDFVHNYCISILIGSPSDDNLFQTQLFPFFSVHFLMIILYTLFPF